MGTGEQPGAHAERGHPAAEDEKPAPPVSTGVTEILRFFIRCTVAVFGVPHFVMLRIPDHTESMQLVTGSAW